MVKETLLFKIDTLLSSSTDYQVTLYHNKHLISGINIRNSIGLYTQMLSMCGC